MRTVVNLVLFKLVWISALFGAASGRSWPGAVSLAASVAIQSMRSVPARLPGPSVLVGVAAMGFAADSALALAGLVGFPESAAVAWPPPAWMSILWLNFGTTLDESLAWASTRPLLAGVSGAVAGPLAYVAGQRAGAISIGPGMRPVLAIAAVWAVAFPCVAMLAARHRTGRRTAASQVSRGNAA